MCKKEDCCNSAEKKDDFFVNRINQEYIDNKERMEDKRHKSRQRWNLS